MEHITPVNHDSFFCTGTQCPAPCAAPVDMTWTRTLGSLCETGLSMACPRAAKLMLLHREATAFSVERDQSESALLAGVSASQLALMLDARRTMDIILQNRSLPFRTDVVLALTYGAEFDPMIATDSRYAYEELDWGFTEQPYRQVQAVVQLQGLWEEKKRDICELLAHIQELCQGESVLLNHLTQTRQMFERMSGAEYRSLRDQFDKEMAPREYLFENLLVYYVHRYFLADAAAQTVWPGLQLLAVSFALIRAMAARLWKETGTLTDNALAALCWQYGRAVEETPEVMTALRERFQRDDLYSRDRLQRLLWN